MKKFRIHMTGPCRGKVWIDDVEMTGVVAISFRASHDAVTQVTLTMNASELEADGEEIDVTNMADTERRFAKGGPN